MANTQFLQEDQVDELKRSRKAVGELNPVVWDDRRNECVSGAHRLRAGWKDVRHIRTKDDAEFFALKLHYNVQRKMPPDELTKLLSDYGDALIASGVPRPDALKQMQDASPYHPNYTYEFIPRRFKSDEGRPPKSEFQISETPLPSGFGMTTGEPEVHLVTCSRCSLRGVVVSGTLQEQ